MSVQEFTELEQYIALNQVPKLVRNGPKPSMSSVYRWIDGGVSGIRLRTVKFGGRRYTTAEWLREFIDAVTTACDSQLARDIDVLVAPRTPTAREQEIDAARARLRDAGVLN